MVRRSQVRHHHLLEGALVIFRIVERDRESLERSLGEIPDQGSDHGRVEAAAEIGSHRHIGAEAYSCCVNEQFPELFNCTALVEGAIAFGAVRGQVQLPVSLRADVSVRDHKRVAGRKLGDMSKCRPRRDGMPERKDLPNSFKIQFPGHRRMSKESLDLRSEEERLFRLAVEERTHAHAIARKKELFLPLIPDGECPLSIELVDALFPFSFVKLQQDFRVRGGGKAPPFALQFLAQLQVIEDFAVERDPHGAVVIVHWLMPAAEIDDAQAGVTKAHRFVQM